ncbi:response regulator [Peristeroidobacter soli]|uniref:response regulator n=1 Tax=Peristeroidobacter soli TaxID=2497877 RepID=UPI00101C9858|nr:response regulator [Peristeroidobacter soli]
MKSQPGMRTNEEAANSRVLVIDNDSSMVLWVRSVLQTEGYDVRTALSGEEALAVLRATPDVLVAISDIHMPGMDGISLLKSLGSLNGAASVPRFIFLTAYPEVDFAVQALRLGAVDFLVKPVRPQELLNAVRSAVERMDQNREAMKLTDQAAMLAQQAEALAAALSVWKHPQTESAAQSAEANRCNLTTVGLDRLRRPRQALEPLGELDDVAWDLLLELLRADKTAQRISVSALSISVPHISPTTALRRIRELVKAGHILRNPDPMDARRDFVMLASECRAALEHYLEQVAKELAAAVAPRT